MNNRYFTHRFRVRLGEYDTRTTRDCLEENGYSDCADPAQDVGVEEAFAHPQYADADRSRHHDVALVRLSRNVHFTGKSS